jgi:pyrroline-5-carboxylate reductase
MEEKIVFIGCGSMAEAIIAGLLKKRLVENNQIYVTNKQDQERLTYMKETYDIVASYEKEKLLDIADVVVLAMKPKDVKESLLQLGPLIKENQLVISVLAGTETKTIEKMLEQDVVVIRTMPNTSAQIGHSTTAITGGKHAEAKHLAFSERLFQSIGFTRIVGEEDMHTVTAVSGSGPAFIYYFVEAMTKAALEAGMDQETAHALITQTVIGAGKMLEESGEKPSLLREKITSEGGTTEAGLNALKSQDFERIIISCIDQARNRSLELGKA